MSLEPTWIRFNLLSDVLNFFDRRYIISNSTHYARKLSIWSRQRGRWMGVQQSLWLYPWLSSDHLLQGPCYCFQICLQCSTSGYLFGNARCHNPLPVFWRFSERISIWTLADAYQGSNDYFWPRVWKTFPTNRSLRKSGLSISMRSNSPVQSAPGRRSTHDKSWLVD